MRHKVRKSATRRKVMGAALGATALANSAVGMFGLGTAEAATQAWIQMCIRNGPYRTGGASNTSDLASS